MTVEYSPSTAPLVLNYFAAKYGIDFNEFLATAKCESGLEARARGDFVKGKPTSWGVFQIHKVKGVHEDISIEQALDPWFSANWAAQQFSKGNQRIWSCYRLLYPDSS